MVPICADLEGHIGRDKRFYILDTARVYPPTAPFRGGIKRQHLWNFFRPEFLSIYPENLSSDAMSGFGAQDSKKDFDAIKTATNELLTGIIPKFAKNIQKFSGINNKIIVNKAHAEG